MKTTKDDILLEALRQFSEKGFEAVSTSMIADELGITKGALYRHFDSKQAIFDQIIDKMFELDAKQAQDNSVPIEGYEKDSKSYKNTSLGDLCKFVNEQFIFWTENEFPCLFRRMITIAQYKSEKAMKLYQDVFALGPVKYTEDIFDEMIKNNKLNYKAKELGAKNLAIQLFAPLQLSIQLFDGGEDIEKIKSDLLIITKDFENRWIN